MITEDIRTRARSVLDAALHGVLATIDENGFPQARTMWTAGVDDDFTIHFVTHRSSAKCAHIAVNPKVCAFWAPVDNGQLGGGFLCIKGEACLTDDQSMRDRFWVDELKEHFAGGKEDPNYVIMIIRPKQLTAMDMAHYPPDVVDF